MECMCVVYVSCSTREAELTLSSEEAKHAKHASFT